MDPSGRMTCEELLDHSYFAHFRDWFQPEVEVHVQKLIAKYYIILTRKLRC